MSVNSRAIRLWITPICIPLAACDRNFESLENVEAVERLSGGSLCQEASVVLMNKDELRESPFRENLQFSISAPNPCLQDFAQSSFTQEALETCLLGSRYACTKEFMGNTVSFYWHSSSRVEMNVWS